MKKKKLECPCCGDEANNLKERIGGETREPLLACVYCWDYASRYWYYIQDNNFPPYKGLHVGDKVWCKIEYDDDTEEWFKGILSSMLLIKTDEGRDMFLYECEIETTNDEGIMARGKDTFWEEEVWFRDPDNPDNLDNTQLDRDIDVVVLNEKLLKEKHVDSPY